MRKTKIICTIGPAVNTKEKLVKLIKCGMNCARFNFSHGTHESQKKLMDLLKEARDATHKNVPILLDTKGPEIRFKDFENVSVMLEDGQKFVIDDNDFFDLEKVKDYLVKTIYYSNRPEEEGLLPKHKEEIKEVLKKENKIRKYVLKKQLDV